MAIVALNTSATGLSALSTQLDVTANNLANINTAGFKSSRANFEDLLYIEKAQPGVENALGDQRPLGVYVGVGVKVSGTQLNFTQGAADPTEQALDLMIDGNGFFQVEIEDDLGEGIGYTRAGNFTLNADGDIVLGTSEGRRLTPSITVPEGATNLTVSADGRITVELPGQTEPEELGIVELATFINPAGLKQVGENLFVPSAASGDPVTGDPAEDGRGTIRQGFLEASNVEPARELVSLIRTQRAFEFNSQVFQAVDEALQTIRQLRRF